MTSVNSRDGYETFQSDSKLLVSVCTSALEPNVHGFINELANKFHRADLDLDVQYYELPYNDIDHCEIKGSHVNIMILCHSINNRGWCITDVENAIYNEFLTNSANILGKARVCVIVHDFPSSRGLSTPDKYRAEMETFKSTQGTAFKHSSLVMMCGKMDGPVEMQETNWEDLKGFLVKAAMPHWWQRVWNFCRRRWLAILVVLAIATIAFGLGVRHGNSSPSATINATATTPTTFSPKETIHPPTTISTTETDTPPNPTTTNRSMHRVYESSLIIISLFSIFMMI